MISDERVFICPTFVPDVVFVDGILRSFVDLCRLLQQSSGQLARIRAGLDGR